MMEIRAENKGIEFVVQINDKTPHLLIGDDIRVKQCIMNLLTNAVKYTQTGTIYFNVDFTDNGDNSIMLNVSVKDTGIGIKQEDMGKLFAPFERIDEANNRAIEGSGLGMSIVQKLLDKMGASLEVHSEYGKGSEFSFSLLQSVVSYEPIGKYSDMVKATIEESAPYKELFHAPDAKILVVDDMDSNLIVFKGLLKQTLVQIDTASSGAQMLDMTSEKKYDILFIDHRMPQMDGIETLKRQKALTDNPSKDAVCIALTANAIQGSREMYIKAGFDDYISKPVHPERLEQMIIKHLSKKLVILPDSPLFIQGSTNEGPANEATRFIGIKGIDLAEALKNCGSIDILDKVINEFYVSISKRADIIEKCAHEQNYEDYTTYVHALKSSARLIGASDLSETAAYLEKCGNEQNYQEIIDLTPKLLEEFRSYHGKFKAFIENEASQTEDKPEISKEELSEILLAIKEFSDAYDFESADSAFIELSSYTLPDSFAEKYNELRIALGAVDRDRILQILG